MTFILRIAVVGSFLLASAQASVVHDAGVEFQGYPAGVISGLRAGFAVSDHLELSARAAYNLTNRQDFGENDDEEGGGFGGGLGLRYYFSGNYEQWFAGVKFDIWALEIDWRNNDNTAGTSDIWVLQPTAQGGYLFSFSKVWRLALTVAVGSEINVDTSGRDVGEGLIGLIGLEFGYKF